VFAEGNFDGFEFAPLNPAVPAKESPLYLITWQHAGIMTETEENGTVYVYDIATHDQPAQNGQAEQIEKQKFMIKCHGGQQIRVKVSRTAHAMLIWSNNFQDKTHKSYYGEH